MKPFCISRMILFAIAAALVALAIFDRPLSGQEAERGVRFDYQVRTDFFAGFRGDREALQRGLKRCEEILATNPNDPEALVWHGAGLYFQVGELIREDQQTGFKLYMRSMQEMNKAVQLAPDSVNVLAPRGAVLLTATRFQPMDERVKGEVRKGIGDFEHMYELQKDRWEQVGTHARGELLIGLASGYQMIGETAKAREYYERTAKEMEGSVYGKNARKWLETGGLAPREQGCLGCHTAAGGVAESK